MGSPQQPQSEQYERKPFTIDHAVKLAHLYEIPCTVILKLPGLPATNPQGPYVRYRLQPAKAASRPAETASRKSLNATPPLARSRNRSTSSKTIGVRRLRVL